MNCMKAIIMAGGEGTRLRPLTCNRPKPMVPVLNKPVMEHIVDLLKRHNITEIGVTLQYMPQVIQDYFGDGTDFGVKMHYFIEETPLGTAGSVKNAEEFLDDTFLVISGDALTDIDITKAITYHNNKNSTATLVLARNYVPLEYGVVVTDESGMITRFLEKPSWSEVFSDTVNTGIYILDPKVLTYFKSGEKFDFSKDLFPMLMKDNQPMYGHVTENYWCDIGDLSAYQQCHFDILSGDVHIQMKAKQIDDKVWVEENVEIGEGVQIKGPVFIGRNTILKPFSVISENTVLGRDNMIGEYSTIKKSILWNGCNLSKKVQLRGCTLCHKVQVKQGSAIFEESVIGDDTVIKERVVVKPNIKVWPSKTIESDNELSVNLVWGTKHTKTLFGAKGIVGEINVDITPEFASRLGASYGAMFSQNAKIAISSGDTGEANMLKSAFVAGLLSSGVYVYDFGQQLLPITRAAIRFYQLEGGIHLDSILSKEDTTLQIAFLNDLGVNISRNMERKLENLFVREDFYRCEAMKVKEVVEMHNYTDYYIRNTVNLLGTIQINNSVLMHTSSAFFKNVFENILNQMGCKAYFSHQSIRTNQDVKMFANEVANREVGMGIIVDKDGEKMTLVDERGQVVSEDMFMALTALITLETEQKACVYVPISAPSVIEKIAENYQGKVVRTKTSILEMMGQMVKEKTKQGATFSKQFILNFDAIGSMLYIMHYMNKKQKTLSQIIRQIPTFYMEKQEVHCPWDAKGKVIRQIIEDSDSEQMELMEGVKIYRDGGWVLVLPDAEKPVCRVIGEGYSEEFAQDITNDFATRVRQCVRANK